MRLAGQQMSVSVELGLEVEVEVEALLEYLTWNKMMLYLCGILFLEWRLAFSFLR